MLKLFFKTILLALLVLLFDQGLTRFLRFGLDRYYGLDKPSEVLFIGHSRTEVGIDSRLIERLTGCTAAVYGVSGTNITAHEAMIRQYLNRYQAPKVIVLNVDEVTFMKGELWGSAYLSFYPYIDDPVINEYVRSRAVSSQEFFVRRYLTLLRFSDVRNLVFRGLCNMRKNNHMSINYNIILAAQNSTSEGRVVIDREKVDQLFRIIESLKKQKVRLILLYIPSTDVETRKNFSQFRETYRLLEQIAAETGTEFDTDPELLSSHHDKFFDPWHLNSQGKEILSNLIATRLQNARREPTK